MPNVNSIGNRVAQVVREYVEPGLVLAVRSLKTRDGFEFSGPVVIVVGDDQDLKNTGDALEMREMLGSGPGQVRAVVTVESVEILLQHVVVVNNVPSTGGPDLDGRIAVVDGDTEMFVDMTRLLEALGAFRPGDAQIKSVVNAQTAAESATVTARDLSLLAEPTAPRGGPTDKQIRLFAGKFGLEAVRGLPNAGRALSSLGARTTRPTCVSSTPASVRQKTFRQSSRVIRSVRGSRPLLVAGQGTRRRSLQPAESSSPPPREKIVRDGVFGRLP